MGNRPHVTEMVQTGGLVGAIGWKVETSREPASVFVEAHQKIAEAFCA